MSVDDHDQQSSHDHFIGQQIKSLDIHLRVLLELLSIFE